MNERFREILSRVAEWEKEAPYNYCDRWCERCVFEKQSRCKIYQDELERKITCIAYGRDEHDAEVTEAVMRRQLEENGEKSEGISEEDEIDWDTLDDPKINKLKEHVEFVRNHPLLTTAEQYRKRAHAFLEKKFYVREGPAAAVAPAYDFETIAWYYTLLPAKLGRALAGFHEPACEGDVALYDAIGQLEVCKKAVRESVQALHRLGPRLPLCEAQSRELLALLHNLDSRIQALQESV